SHGAGGARGLDVEDRRGSAFLLPPARPLHRGRRQHDRERLLQAGLQGAPHGVRRGGPEAHECFSRGQRRLTMLEIKNLHATAGDKPVLKGLTLSVKAGEVSAIMGPNGSGKSTLAHVLSGRDGFKVTEGSVLYKGKDLLAISPEE